MGVSPKGVVVLRCVGVFLERVNSQNSRCNSNKRSKSKQVPKAQNSNTQRSLDPITLTTELALIENDLTHQRHTPLFWTLENLRFLVALPTIPVTLCVCLCVCMKTTFMKCNFAPFQTSIGLRFWDRHQ